MDSQLEKVLETMDTNGTKRLHTSDNSNSDKDNAWHVANISLALVSLMPTQGEWRKVEKKKGRKAWIFSLFVHYFLLLFEIWSAVIDFLKECITTSTTCNFVSINKIMIFFWEKGYPQLQGLKHYLVELSVNPEQNPYSPNPKVYWEWVMACIFQHFDFSLSHVDIPCTYSCTFVHLPSS